MTTHSASYKDSNAGSPPGLPSESLRSRNLSALSRTQAELQRLDLGSHVQALDAWGYTVIKGVLDASLIERAKAAICRRIEATQGICPDLATATEEDFKGQSYQPYLLYDDPVFVDILMQDAPLALITHLLGESARLSSIGCHFKGPGGDPLLLHSDNGNGMPAPFPAYAQVANINYALTPYSRAAGALAMVPGSHHLARHPTPLEAQLHGDKANKQAISMDIDPGDAVIWHGNTWHGSFRRETPGIRMNLAVYFSRQYIAPQEHHPEADRDQLVAQYASHPRLARILGGKQPYGWEVEGPDYKKMGQNPTGLFD